MSHPGFTRSNVQRNHALIAPDSHVTTSLPGWRETEGSILIAPHMGAGFTQYLANLQPHSVGLDADAGVQRFVFVLEGAARINAADKEKVLEERSYAWFPPDQPHTIETARSGRLLVFEKEYIPLGGTPVPQAQFGNAEDVKSEPFLGDSDALLRTLLPSKPGFDWGVNLFTYKPGATLPFVETHVMEHGAYMLEGAGIYRLDEAWYPVQEGDTIWMGPFCAQWFAAIGKGPASYIYSKDMNRGPMIA